MGKGPKGRAHHDPRDFPMGTLRFLPILHVLQRNETRRTRRRREQRALVAGQSLCNFSVANQDA